MLPLLVCLSCTKHIQEGQDGGADNIINIGGIAMDSISAGVEDGMPFTKADGYVPAEDQGWLLGPLFHGLEVRYKQDAAEKNRIARLVLERKPGATGYTKDDILKINNLAVYSLNYVKDFFPNIEGPAKWDGNGQHIFQGVYVPEEIRQAAGSEPAVAVADALTTDQSGDNYTYLNHYLAMPANTRLNATTGRVILPYGHRLCHVIAYVLIDPAMGSDVHLQGFELDAEEQDDPHTTLFRFGNVDVLDYVEKQTETSGNERLIPRWTKSRKVIPHFFGMRNSRNSKSVEVADHFLLFHEKATQTDIYPTNDAKWTAAKNDWDTQYNSSPAGATEAEKIKYANGHSKYERVDYGLVPCYDIIARPTYTSKASIMYDEEDKNTFGHFNKIDFELTLNTGLSYSKTFEFLLDANYQTVVFLKINQVAVDYNEAGSEKWVETSYEDGYYGVNNRNGNALSKTGSSWQRAYRIGEKSKNWNVTDGHKYDNNDGTIPEDCDTLSQYVKETTWMDLFKQACMVEDELNPGSYTVLGKRTGDYFILDGNITIDLSKTETGEFPKPFIFTGHLDCQGHTITLIHAGDKIFTPGKEAKFVETTDYTQDELYVKVGEDYVLYEFPSEVYMKISDNPEEYAKVEGLTLQDFMEDTANHYYRKDGEVYVIMDRPVLYVWYPGEFHFTPSYLFAGLNGIYDAPAGASDGDYNIYTQGGVKVPYADNGVGGTGTGWRAEILNANIVGGKLFCDDPTDPLKAHVTGYVYNCTQGGVRVPDHVPARPKY